MSESSESLTGLEIAVIGMSCRFPGAGNISQYWENLKNGVESITFFSEEELIKVGVKPEIVENPNYIKARGLLSGIEYFDSSFFGYSSREAEIMDPQMRIFHEIAWEALEDSGYVSERFAGLIGFFGGAAHNHAWLGISAISGKIKEMGFWAANQLIDKNYLTMRISYKLNLKGPSFSLYTACSTSLVSVHVACQAILNGECDMALAGGITLILPANTGYMFQEGMIMSPDGHCRVFVADAAGTIGGEGGGIVVLKRLEDAIADRDHIYAVVKGSAVNNDGIRKSGFTAPSVEGQVEVIDTAQQMAQVKPVSIGFVETHGTGTPIGDPIEIEALTLVFKTTEKNFCALGSVKSNFGHLDAAAGIAGFIKAVLAIIHGFIPPTLHFETPNPEIDFEHSPFYVNTELTPWKSSVYPLRAGVSSFGIGGTNAHVILEEAPGKEQKHASLSSLSNMTTPFRSREYQLILLSAKTKTALENMAKKLGQYLKEHPDTNLADAAYTLHIGRKRFQHRCLLTCSSVDEAIDLLTKSNHAKVTTHFSRQENPSIVFMFSGLGSQYIDMGRDLYEKEPVFSREMERCFNILNTLVDYDIKEILYPRDSLREVSEGQGLSINQIEIAQIVVFIFEYALAKLLIQWGIKPHALMGYSFGEYVAGCVSGVFSLEDALMVVVSRGRLIRQLPQGGMLSVPLPADEITPYLNPGLALAIDNGPSCIVSGSTATIKDFEKQMKTKRLMCMPVPSSHALHSNMMEPMLEEFTQTLNTISLNKPRIPYISNISGDWISAEQATAAGYWVSHLRQTVRFADGMKVLLKKMNPLFVEIGPGHDISSLVQRHIEARGNGTPRVINLVRPSYKKIPDDHYLLNKIGLLWLYGLPIDGNGFYGKEKRYRIPLPTYPFEGKRYWIEREAGKISVQKQAETFEVQKKPDIGDWFYIPQWKRSMLKGENLHGIFSTSSYWLIFINDCSLTSYLIKQLVQNRQHVIIVNQGSTFSRERDNGYTIRSTKDSDYTTLFKELKALNKLPDKIIHMWNVTGIPTRNTGQTATSAQKEPGMKGSRSGKDGIEIEEFEEAQYRGFYSLIYIAKAAAKLRDINEIQIEMVSNHLQEVTGNEILNPARATLLGPVKVIPQEYPYIICRSVDIEEQLPAPGSPHEKRLVRQLLMELNGNSSDTIIAYRGNYRWVQEFEPLHLGKSGESAENGSIPGLKREGIYLVTGGLGNIGFSLATYLAEKLKARLILTGRTLLPERNQWKNWLKNHNKEDPISRKIRKVKQLEKKGSNVLVFGVDASDLGGMQKVITRTEERFGRINGVIHAAGEMRESILCPVEKVGETICKLQFNPKVYGLLVLKKILENREPDFCLLTSSLSSVLGGLGMVTYAAANSFMDTFVHCHNRKNNGSSPPAWLSLNWADWRFSSAPVQDQTQGRKIGAAAVRLTITPEEGIETFLRILNQWETHPGINQVVVSAGDLQTRLDQWVKLESLRHENKNRDGLEKDDPTSLSHSRPDLFTPYVPPKSQLESDLVQIWEKIFGFRSIGIKDDFFELSGDSLKAIMAIANIHKKLHVEITLREFFNHPTIEEFADYIERKSTSSYSTVEASEKKEYYALSAPQKRLYILQKMEPESTAYNETKSVWLEGEVNRNKIQNLFIKLIRRHEIYRTSIILIEDALFQKVHPYEEIDFNIDYHEVPEDEARHLVNGFIKPFDLNQAPLLRVLLIKVSPLKHILVMDIHHIITDLTSDGIFIKEFIALYREKKLPLLSLHYKDFAQWQNRETQQETLKRQENYWLEKFTGEIPVLRLPTDFSRPGIQTFEGGVLGFTIDKTRCQDLKKLALKENVTLYMVLLSILDILLWKLSGQEDIIIGTPVAGRKRGELQQLIGVFVNTLALRNRVTGEKNYTRFLQDIRQDTLAAFDNQDYPFEELVDKIMVNRDLSRSPLFDVSFVLQNMEERPDRVLKGEDPGIKLSAFSNDHLTSKFDLTLMVFESNQRLSCSWQYCTKLFKRESIKRFTAYFKKIVDTITRNQATPLQHLDILPEKEKKQILYEFNNTAVEYPRGKNLCQLFAEQVSRTPDQIALVASFEQTLNDCGEIGLSYRELNEKSNQLAYLLKEKGDPRNSIVGIALQRSVEMMVGLLGILKVGAAYLPIDPDFPRERIQYMLTDSSAHVLVTDRGLVEDGKIGGWDDLKNLELVFPDLPSPSAPVHPEIVVPATALAYVIYTSGSTGNPKGSAVHHQGIVNRLFWMQEVFQLGSEDRVLQKTPFSFDVSVWEFFWPLLNGAALVMARPGGHKDSAYLVEIINKERITTLHFVPSMLGAFLECPGVETLYPVKRVISSGEALPAQYRDRFFSTFPPHVQLYNLYGPTEASVDVTFYPCNRQDDGAVVPIGKPIANTRIYILDRNLNLVPIGVYGEIYIEGIQLARGYLNNPELTSEKFCLWQQGGRFLKKLPPFTPRKNFLLFTSLTSHHPPILYKTGDLARWLQDGEIEFLGRMDHQVKVRGFRIELGEIENQLMKLGIIKEVVVINRLDESGSSYLCAYFTAGESLEPSELRMFLSGKLPDYMIPDYFVQIDNIPLTANGKIDRKALPKPETGEAGVYMPPGNELEEKLVGIWAQVLGMEKEKISVNANFFELGGQSLKAIILTARIHKELNVKLSLAEVFTKPKIKELARGIKDREGDTYTSIEPVEKKEYYGLSPAQNRLYILQQFDPESIAYNMFQAIPLPVVPDKEKLANTFVRLIQRHESLRTSFRMMDEKPVQRIHDKVEFEIEYHESGKETERQRGKEEEIHYSSLIDASDHFVRPFDLTRAPLLRVVILKTSEQRCLMMVDMHHIITDGISHGILKKDFMNLYKSKGLLPLKLQYKDFSQWQNSEEQKKLLKHQELYWVRVFSPLDELPVLHLPLDYPRPPLQSFAGASQRFVLNQEKTLALKKIAKQFELTPYMIVLSAYILLLVKLSGQEDIIVGTPSAGRRHADLEPIIGMFVNTLPIRSYPYAARTVNQLLQEVKNQTLQAFDHQEYPFEELVVKLSLPRDTSRNPVFDVMFNWWDRRGKQRQVHRDYTDDKNFANPEHQSGGAKFDLNLRAFDREDTLFFELEYCSKLFKTATIDRMIAYFNNIIAVVTAETDKKIKNVEFIPGERKKEILLDFNRDLTDTFAAGTLQNKLFESFQRYADAIACIYGARHITYSELDKNSSVIFTRIIEQGITEQNLIGFYLDDRIDIITAIIGILKARCLFVPLDTVLPIKRIQHLLQHTNLRVIFTTDTHKEGLQENGIDIVNKLECIPIHPYVYFDPQSTSTSQPLTDNRRFYHENDKIYVYFTSGTTGTPGAIVGNNSSLLNFVHWEIHTFGIHRFFHVSQFAAVGFDAFLRNVFTPLCAGATTCIPESPHLVMDSRKLIHWIDKYDIGFIHCVPAIFRLLTSQPLTPQHFKGLKYILMSGEVVYPQDVIKWQKIFAETIKLVNCYGPTETTVIKLFHIISASDVHKERIPIGIPMRGSSALILDQNQGICDIGITGELYIRTFYSTHGYLNNPQLTHEKFILNPFTHDPGDLIYRTGDMARKLADGNIEFLGRKDRQVKIRGNRVEPREIENYLMTHEDIKESVVVVYFPDKPGDSHDEFADSSLCAYIVSNRELPAAQLREFLARELPAYMIPSYFIPLERIPLTPNGKLDSKSLPPPGTGIINRQYNPPQDEIEKKLQKIWSLVLNVEPQHIILDDNFFAIGGHSLKATVMIAKIHREMDINVPLVEVFKSQTLRELSAYIRQANPEKFKTIEILEKKEYYEMSSAQKRMYIIWEQEKDNDSYLMNYFFLLEGELDINSLANTFKQLVKRHEILRTSFDIIGPGPMQKVHDEVEFEISFPSAVEDKTLSQENSAPNHILPDYPGFIRPFDLHHPPLIRVGMVEKDQHSHLLMICMHHIVSDGFSLGILVNDCLSLYQEKNIPPLKIQYKDFARWQNMEKVRDMLEKQENYWMDQFNDIPPVLNLPYDFAPSGSPTYEGKRLWFSLDASQTKILREIVKEEGATLFMVMLAIFNILLAKISGQEDIVIGTPIAGRRHDEVGQLIGMFVNMLALRNFPTREKTFMQFFKEVKQKTLQAFDNQDYQLEELVNKLAKKPGNSGNPIFNAILLIQNLDNQRKNIPGLSLKPYTAYQNLSAKFDLQLDVYETREQLRFLFIYRRKLFKPGTIKRLITFFKAITANVVKDPGMKLAEIIKTYAEKEKKHQAVFIDDLENE